MQLVTPFTNPYTSSEVLYLPKTLYLWCGLVHSTNPLYLLAKIGPTIIPFISRLVLVPTQIPITPGLSWFLHKSPHLYVIVSCTNPYSTGKVLLPPQILIPLA